MLNQYLQPGSENYRNEHNIGETKIRDYTSEINKNTFSSDKNMVNYLMSLTLAKRNMK